MSFLKDPTNKIKAYLLNDLGFNLVGIASAKPHPDYSFFSQWLEKGFQGQMKWLTKEPQKRQNPKLLAPFAQSIICVGLLYKTQKMDSRTDLDSDQGWVSHYALGRDYHRVISKKFKKLQKTLNSYWPKSQHKFYVDTGPVLERSFAKEAGLGWIGKNTCLIHPQKGSFFFLGVFLTSLNLNSDQPMIDHCGHCQRCLDACPTQALTPYELDSNKCISYLTIEYKDAIPAFLTQKMGSHIAGCDICQEVCPWNSKTPLATEADFLPRSDHFKPKIKDWLSLSQEDYLKKFEGSPVRRLGYSSFLRNLKIAQKNQRDL